MYTVIVQELTGWRTHRTLCDAAKYSERPVLENFPGGSAHVKFFGEDDVNYTLECEPSENEVAFFEELEDATIAGKWIFDYYEIKCKVYVYYTGNVKTFE